MPEEKSKKISYRILSAESLLEGKESPRKEEKEKEETKTKLTKLIIPSYVFIFGGLLLIIIIFILVFRPYQKISKLIKKEEKTNQTQPVVIFFILPKKPTTSQEKILTTTKEKSQDIKEIIATKTEEKEITTSSTPTPFYQTYTYPTKEFPFVKYFPNQKFNISEMIMERFEKELNSLLSKQQASGSLIYYDLVSNDKKIPLDFILDYFLKPTKTLEKDFEKFKEELTGNYAFFVYYTYTRKFPFLVFEINDVDIVKDFNQKWEKESMAKDLKTLFLNFDPGKLIKNKFTTQNLYDFSYQVIYFENNYEIIWGIKNNYLIYSSSEEILEKIIPYIR